MPCPSLFASSVRSLIFAKKAGDRCDLRPEPWRDWEVSAKENQGRPVGRRLFAPRFEAAARWAGRRRPAPGLLKLDVLDRKSVVKGKSVYVRLDLGGGRTIKNIQDARFTINTTYNAN